MKNIKNNVNLEAIPGVGKSIAEDLRNIGIQTVADLRGKDPEKLFEMSNCFEGKIQDRCLLYVYREAVYFAENPNPDPEKLKWWNWKDEYEYQFDPNTHITFISDVFDAVVDGKIKTVKNKSAKDAIVKVLDDYFVEE